MRKWIIWWARFPGNLILSWQSLLKIWWICIQIILCSCTNWFQLLTYQNLELPEKRVLAVGLFRSYWPVGMSVGVCGQLSSLWPSPLLVGLFPIQGGPGLYKSGRGWLGSNGARTHKFSLYLLLTVDVLCLVAWVPSLTSSEWWTVSQINSFSPLSSILLLARIFYYINSGETRPLYTRAYKHRCSCFNPETLNSL